MEMQQVRYFLAVARTLNFTRAAEECNVTQPALTRAIKQLEDEFGGELIRREGRNSHLSELGQRMLKPLQQCYDSAESAKLLATKIKKGETPVLSLGVSRTFYVNHLLGPLDELRRAFPGLQLKLRRGTGSEISDLLKSGEIDLAIGGPIRETWDRLEAWPMFSEAFDLVVGPEHELAARNELELDVELFQSSQFLLHTGIDAAELQFDSIDALRAGLDSAHQVECTHDLEVLVGANFGITLMPANTLNSGLVKHINVVARNLQRTVAIYSAAGRPRSREASAFLSTIRMADWSALSARNPADSI